MGIIRAKIMCFLFCAQGNLVGSPLYRLKWVLLGKKIMCFLFGAQRNLVGSSFYKLK